MYGRIVFIRRKWFTVKIDDLCCVRARVEMGMMQLAWIKVSGRPSPPASRPPALPPTGIDFVNLLGSSPVHPLLSQPAPFLPMISCHHAVLPFVVCILPSAFQQLVPFFHFLTGVLLDVSRKRIFLTCILMSKKYSTLRGLVSRISIFLEALALGTWVKYA